MGREISMLEFPEEKGILILTAALDMGDVYSVTYRTVNISYINTIYSN